jgi:orotate phosphoribosyltransferase
VTGGALLAHTMAGLLDSRRPVSHAPTLFAPFAVDASGGHTLSRFYRRQLEGRRVLVVDDVRNTGQTLVRCAALVTESAGIVIGMAEICDRMEAVVESSVPNFPLVEYKAPENFPAATCPLCKAGIPINTF